MRTLIRRPLTCALSLLLLGVLAAYGLGLTHGHPARAGAAPLGTLRNLCAPHHTVCGQVVPGVLSATLLIGLARARAGLSVATTTSTASDHSAQAGTQTASQAPSLAPLSPETLLSLATLVVALSWLALPQRVTRMAGLAHVLPTRSIPAHLCTPAP